MACSAQSLGWGLIAGWNRTVGLFGGGWMLPLFGLILAANYVVHPAVHRHVDAHPHEVSSGSCASHDHPLASACCPHSHSKPQTSPCNGADEDRSGESGHSHCELCDGLTAETPDDQFANRELKRVASSQTEIFTLIENQEFPHSIDLPSVSHRGPPPSHRT